MTIRNSENEIAYEQMWDIYSPHITKIEVVEFARRRRAKLYYMRDRPAKVGRLYLIWQPMIIIQ